MDVTLVRRVRQLNTITNKHSRAQPGSGAGLYETLNIDYEQDGLGVFWEWSLCTLARSSSKQAIRGAVVVQGLDASNNRAESKMTT